MLVESCELLCTTHHVMGIYCELGEPTPNKEEIPYKKCFENHPCAKWVRESLANYRWLLELAKALAKEYTYRTGKHHKSESTVMWLSLHTPFYRWPDEPMTQFAQVINPYKFHEAIVDGDIFQSYKNYHRLYKQGFFRKDRISGEKIYHPYTWTKRQRPLFMGVK